MVSPSSGIASWPQEERPRERLLSRGPQALTDAELIGILLRIGVKGTNAVELGRQLLSRYGSLRALVEAPVLSLLEVKGLKGAKAAQLLAAIEIARRFSIPTKRGDLVIKTTSAAATYLLERLRGLSTENFRALFLNRRHALQEDALIAQGSLSAVQPNLRGIISMALQVNASAIIVAHNHPSGSSEPSESDRLLTQDLIAACRPLGLQILDHIIVAEDSTYSFADSGLLDELSLLCLVSGPGVRTLKLSKRKTSI